MTHPRASAYAGYLTPLSETPDDGRAILSIMTARRANGVKKHQLAFQMYQKAGVFFPIMHSMSRTKLLTPVNQNDSILLVIWVKIDRLP